LKKKSSGGNLNYALVLLGETDNYFCILMDEDLARSLIMRLYYFGGRGLKYFKPFYEDSDLTGRTQIMTYKVDWDEFIKDLPFSE